jgi:hypothetical protein
VNPTQAGNQPLPDVAVQVQHEIANGIHQGRWSPAGTFVAAHVRISDGIDQPTSAKIHNGTMECEAGQILANLGTTCR